MKTVKLNFNNESVKKSFSSKYTRTSDTDNKLFPLTRGLGFKVRKKQDFKFCFYTLCLLL